MINDICDLIQCIFHKLCILNHDNKNPIENKIML